MARLTFPDDRFVIKPSIANAPLRSAAGDTATVFTDAAGTVLADIQTEAGAAVAGSVLTVDVYSQLPLFLGPDGVDTLYVSVNGGPVSAIYARVDDRLDAAVSSVSVESGARAAADTALGGRLDTVEATLPTLLPTATASATYVAKSTDGYTGSTALAQTPPTSPSPVDQRGLVTPAPRDTLDQSSRRVLDRDLIAGRRRNIWQHTEDLANARYGVASGAAKTTDTVTTVDGVVLTRLTTTGFFSALNSPMNTLSLNLLTSGNYYLLSYYVLSRNSAERFFWMRNVAASRGHGFRFTEPNVVRRVWTIQKASSANHLVGIADPSVGYPADTSYHPVWFQQGRQEEGDSAALSFYVGGFQIEDLGTTLPKDGIACIGDSTIQGASGSADAPIAREIPAWLGALLNTSTYNRGISGDTLAGMDARWATDVTAIKAVCKYVLIQGGVNDINQSVSLASMQTSLASLVTKALADSLTPVLVTVTPSIYTAADATKEQKRLDYNAWLKATYPNVIDIAQVVADPFDSKYLRRTPGGASGWYGDGVHYTRQAKRAIAERLAAWSEWSLPTPAPYQKVAATTFTGTGGVVLVSPDGTLYRLTVANGGALSTTAL